MPESKFFVSESPAHLPPLDLATWTLRAVTMIVRTETAVENNWTSRRSIQLRMPMQHYLPVSSHSFWGDPGESAHALRRACHTHLSVGPNEFVERVDREGDGQPDDPALVLAVDEEAEALPVVQRQSNAAALRQVLQLPAHFVASLQHVRHREQCSLYKYIIVRYTAKGIALAKRVELAQRGIALQELYVLLVVVSYRVDVVQVCPGFRQLFTRSTDI